MTMGGRTNAARGQLRPIVKTTRTAKTVALDPRRPDNCVQDHHNRRDLVCRIVQTATSHRGASTTTPNAYIGNAANSRLVYLP